MAAQSKALSGTERSPGDDGLVIISGRHKSALMTSHREYGIGCVVDLNNTFFITDKTRTIANLSAGCQGRTCIGIIFRCRYGCFENYWTDGS